MNRINKALSDTDIKRILGPDIKIFTYGELENYKFDDILPEKRSFCIILIEDSPDKGHWVALSRDPKNKMVTWFDSYGITPSRELQWIPKEQNKKLDNEEHDIKDHLDYAIRELGYDVIYNRKKFQKEGDWIKTCGRHCVFWIQCFMAGLDLYDYISMMNKLKRDYKLDSDQIVSYIIKE